MSVRGKTRRTSSPDSPTVGQDSSDFGGGDAALQVAINSSHFTRDNSWGGVSGATEALELNRRCLSCCSLVLQLLAGIDGNERKMVRRITHMISSGAPCSVQHGSMDSVQGMTFL